MSTAAPEGQPAENPTAPASSVAAGARAGRRPAGARGGSWTARDQPTTIWLVLAGLAAVGHHWWPGSGWVVVHLLLLGALSHSVLVWSTHFAQALLKTSPDIDPRWHQSIRLWTLTAGAACVVVGVPLSWPVLVMVGATLVVAAVAWHAWALWRRVRAALPGRFRITLRYYLLAALSLAAGATFGVLLALGPGAQMHGRLLVAHTLTMLLGWLGLTVTGTLLTLWPTMLRTRMDDRAERLTQQALPVLVGALVVLDAGALAGWRWVALAGLVGYAAGLVWWGRALVKPASVRPPHEFAPASVACAMFWAVVALVRVGQLLVHSSSWSAVYAGYGPVAALVALGFGLQILMGALSYLIPMSLGGGPATARALTAGLNRFGATRLLLTNAAVATFVLPMSSGLRTAVQLIGLVAAGVFLPLMALGVKAFVRSRRSGQPMADPGEARPFWTPVGVGVAVAALVAAGAVTSGTTASTAVVATGHTTTVAVTMKNMRFVPSSVTVPQGDRLVVDLTNADTTSSHDLVLASGAASALIAPKGTASLDAGIIAASEEGWCSQPGHRQQGMVFQVVVEGSDAATTATTSASSASGVDTGTLAQTPFDAGFLARDPKLAPLTTAKGATHTLTWHIRQVKVQVAAGVWQTRWTYAGTSPGPVLHGRVGDTFRVTIVNDTTMGHSLDFHAGDVAPDSVMRTLAPGASLTYTFTAQRAGAWLYHCSTSPISTHIAAGMFGAVVVEPDNLPSVGASYLFVQSEMYLSGSHAQSDAAQVDANRTASGNPDLVAFNGSAFQYVAQPVKVGAHERVRIWVVDAGPTVPLDFHVVGTQFDTVWAEGSYLLPRGTSGGSQVLSLGAAQGGFVELTFPGAGHYSFVNHAFGYAERGAKGIFVAS